MPPDLRVPEPPPDLGPEWRAQAQGNVRYEDISQDGRAVVLALPHGLGLSVWQNLLAHKPAAHALQRAGVIPILTRMVIEGGDGPLSVRKPVTFAGACQFAHTVDAKGAVNRIVLNMWVDVSAPAGRTHGPPPPNAGQTVHAGRVFAEHVFTRLFAPPGQRKVLRLDVLDGSAPGSDAVPEARYDWRAPDELLALPAGATWLEPEPRADDAVMAFGLHHTDSNQHVNSLVYPRLFEDAALRRFAALGRSSALLCRFVEVAYREPCFAGDRMRLVMRAFELDGQPGVVGAYVPAAGLRIGHHGLIESQPAVADAAGRPHAVLRLLYSP